MRLNVGLFVFIQIIGDLEQQVRMLRDEVAGSNNLRKQQLVELGLLREEGKQKMERDHEVQVRNEDVYLTCMYSARDVEEISSGATWGPTPRGG
jgi:hypothetical protein